MLIARNPTNSSLLRKTKTTTTITIDQLKLLFLYGPGACLSSQSSSAKNLNKKFHLQVVTHRSAQIPIRPSLPILRTYSHQPTDRRPPGRPTFKKHSPPTSFRAGPFKGALLPESTEQQQSDEAQKPSDGNHPIIQAHDYSPSQLRQSFKHSSDHQSSAARLHFPHSRLIKDHLEDLLYPLKFSEQLACRIVSSKNLVKSQASLDALDRNTPGGIGFARLGEHNAKLSFMGRRMMHFALSNFLLHAPTVDPSTPESRNLSAGVIEAALLTRFMLGQYVGHRWELEKIMRWRELSSQTAEESEPQTRPSSTGLWTARGHVVEAIIGAVMVQHGTRLSTAVFNALVLPHLAFRLDSVFLPAIKAIQSHDQEFENLQAGLVDWNHLDPLPFVSANSSPSHPPLRSPSVAAAVG